MKLDMIAFEAEMKRLRGAYIMDIAPACEMYRAALARAEAAEAEAATLKALCEKRHDEWRTAEGERDAERARAEAAEAEAEDAILVASDAAQREENAMHALSHFRARVAELEAQLAAQQWRPVTEKPEKPGWYSVYDSDGHVFYNADIFPYRVARWTGKWDSAFNGLIDYWRPLPPAPQETE